MTTKPSSTLNSATLASVIRTAVQVAGSSAFVATLTPLAHHLPSGVQAGVVAVVTVIAAAAHNALENAGIISTWLRQPALTPAGEARVSAKLAKDAQAKAVAAAAQAAKIAGQYAPIIDALVPVVEAKISEAQHVADAATARVLQPEQVAPVIAEPSVPAPTAVPPASNIGQ